MNIFVIRYGENGASYYLMSDFELFSAMMMVLAIVVKLLICLINAKK